MNEIHYAFHHTPLFRVMEYCVSDVPRLHPDRILPYHVLLYVHHGSIPVTEDHIHYEIQENQIFFLKAGLHHWSAHEIPAGTTWTYIHFYLPRPEINSNYLDLPVGYSRNQEFLPKDFLYHVALPKQMTVHRSSSIKTDLSTLLSSGSSKDGLRHVKCNQFLSQLLIKLYEQSLHLQQPGKQDIHLYKLIHYLEQHFNAPLNSKQISGYMDMNYRYLCDIFKRKTGMSITMYHTKLRISESCRLLRESSLNISEISQSAGYSDPLYFSTVFKRIVGISPSLYRRQTFQLYEMQGS